MNSFPPQPTKWGKILLLCSSHCAPTILFINVKYCRSLAPKRLSDPKLPQREGTGDRQVEVGGQQRKNRTKSELKYKAGKNKETGRKVCGGGGGGATQGNILYKKRE